MRKLRVVFENCRASDLFDVVNRGREANGAGNIWCASLKSMGCSLKYAFFQSDAHDHFAATVPRGHGIEDLGSSIKRADAGRATHFVSGEGEVVTSQLLHIDGQMSRALCGIHQCERTDGMRFLAEFGHGINCAERV